MLKYEDKKYFGIDINGVNCGCWFGDKPYWGFQCNTPSEIQKNMVCSILKEAGMNADSILVATGTNFADSLSASAAGLPMLLVKDSLNNDQKAFLEKYKGKTLYILGGTSAVNSAVEKELKKYGEVKRVAGASRFETSIEIAKTFFDEPYYAMFAYSNDYPDGLCGGPIGFILRSPLILTKSDKLTEATKYCKDKGIVEAIVFGGEARLTNNDVKKLLNQKSLHFEEHKYED